MDYTAITGAVSFTDVLTALGVVGAGVAALLIAIRGARTLLGFIRR